MLLIGAGLSAAPCKASSSLSVAHPIAFLEHAVLACLLGRTAPLLEMAHMHS